MAAHGAMPIVRGVAEAPQYRRADTGVVRLCGARSLLSAASGGLLVALLLPAGAFVAEPKAEAWPVCDNRAYRDEDIEPGGLRLLGVKESPLGDYPQAPAATTHEHFFQQLREVWGDDCPRVMVQVGLQPAAGPLRNWTSAALWLHYFNDSGIVLAVDAVDDYLRHFEDAIRASPVASVSEAGGGKVSVQTVHAAVVPQVRGGKSKMRPVVFPMPGGKTVQAADEIMRGCSAHPDADDERHPCARILRRMASPEPLEYLAPAVTFDGIWAQNLRSRHVDFLQIDIGAAGMFEMFQRGLSKILTEREVSILSFRVDELWTKAELISVVTLLDKHEYFSMFKMVCSGSSQVGSFSYVGPGGAGAGPTTYLPLSGIELEKVLDWERMPVPQDVFAFDLRQPDIFRTVQLGDSQCDADEDLDDESCAADGSGRCASRSVPPGKPVGLRAVIVESRTVTFEWRTSQEGGAVDAYELRVDPGAMEETLDQDMFDIADGALLHTVGSLRPGTAYTLRLRAVGSGGESEEAELTYRTKEETATASTGAAYEVLESLHCGMSSAEEVSPAGPPPNGASFFLDVTDPEGCRARCDDNRQCVAFQVKVDEACWLYRRRPMASRLRGPRGDVGWFCGVRRDDAP